MSVHTESFPFRSQNAIRKNYLIFTLSMVTQLVQFAIAPFSMLFNKMSQAYLLPSAHRIPVRICRYEQKIRGNGRSKIEIRLHNWEAPQKPNIIVATLT